MVPQDHLDLVDQAVLVDRQDHLEHQVLMVLLALVDPLDRQVLRDLVDRQALVDPQEHQAHQAHQEHQDHQDHLVRQGLEEALGLQVLLVFLDLTEAQVLLDRLVLLVSLVLMVLMVLLERQERQDYLVISILHNQLIV